MRLYWKSPAVPPFRSLTNISLKFSHNDVTGFWMCLLNIFHWEFQIIMTLSFSGCASVIRVITQLLAWSLLTGHSQTANSRTWRWRLGAFAWTRLHLDSPSFRLLSLLRIPVIEFRTRPTPTWPHFNLSHYICKDPISKGGDILRFYVSVTFGETPFNPVQHLRKL